jgi:hypothetical protein
MKNFVTPSLSVFKSDAAVMLREFREGCPVAVKRLSHTKSFKRGNVRLGTCLRVIASEYGCSGLMKPDTHLGENARQIEVSDDQTTPFLFC